MDSDREEGQEEDLEAVEVEEEETLDNLTKAHQLLSSHMPHSFIDAKINSLSSALT